MESGEELSRRNKEAEQLLLQRSWTNATSHTVYELDNKFQHFSGRDALRGDVV